MQDQEIDSVKLDDSEQDVQEYAHDRLYKFIKEDDRIGVETLLQDPDVLSTIHENDNYALCLAAHHARWDLILRLLQVPAVLATVGNTGYRLFYASDVGRLDVIHVLMELDVMFARAAADDNILLFNASKYNDKDLVKKLLTNSDVADRLAFKNNWILGLASDYRTDDLVWLLATTPRSTLLNSDYNELMIAIVEERYAEALEIIDQTSDQQLNHASDFGFTALMLAAGKFALNKEAYNKQVLEVIERLLLRSADITRTARHHSFPFIADQSGLLQHAVIIAALIRGQNTQAVKLSYNGRNILHIFLEHGDQSGAVLLNYLQTLPELLQSLINELDYSGNSPLSYALLAPAFKHKPEMLHSYVEQGALFIRNQKECRTPLHMAVLCKQPILFSAVHSRINQADEHGCTVLHYACIRGDQDLACYLIAQGASLELIDKSLRSALHYAAFKSLVLPGVTPAMMQVEDIFGLSPAVYAKDNQQLDLLGDDKLNLWQRLARLSNFKYHDALNNPFEHIAEDFDNAAKSIIEAEFSNTFKYPAFEFASGWALGIELEIAELPAATFIPLSEFNVWFGMNLVIDKSVRNSALSLYAMDPKGVTPCEYNSPIINSSSKYHSLLAVCDALLKSGARVNQSCAFHLHVNVNGSEQDLNTIVSQLVSASNKLVFIKYVIMNYIRVETLLRGFMRGGRAFNYNDGHYDVLISEYTQQIQACEDIGSICNLYIPHGVSLNISALRDHGTIEFRMHEGTLEPILINAWVDCVTRLIAISLKQTENHLEHAEIQAKDDIEQLVYLFIATRNYNKTWDPVWGAVKSADVPSAMPYPGHDQTPYQLQIMRSPLYNMLTIILESPFEKLAEKLCDYIATEADAFKELPELEKLVIFSCDNPGLLPTRTDKVEILGIINDLALSKRRCLYRLS